MQHYTILLWFTNLFFFSQHKFPSSLNICFAYFYLLFSRDKTFSCSSIFSAFAPLMTSWKQQESDLLAKFIAIFFLVWVFLRSPLKATWSRNLSDFLFVCQRKSFITIKLNYMWKPLLESRIVTVGLLRVYLKVSSSCARAFSRFRIRHIARRTCHSTLAFEKQKMGVLR